MRRLFIAGGITLVNSFHWLIFVFGGFIIFTGIEMVQKKENIRLEKNPVVRVIRRFLPVTSDYEGSNFFVKKTGHYLLTPLFIVVMVVGTMDVVFAMDSVPAVLGLRSFYFALAGIMQSLRHLRYGLAGVLVFVGARMLISDYYTIPITASLGVICMMLLATMISPLFEPKITKTDDLEKAKNVTDEDFTYVQKGETAEAKPWA
jgi:tellurite resistance protein TerC